MALSLIFSFRLSVRAVYTNCWHTLHPQCLASFRQLPSEAFREYCFDLILMGHQLLLVLLTIANPAHVSWVWPHGIQGPVLLRFYVSLVGFSSDFPLNLSVPEASILGLLCVCVFSWGNLFTSFLSFWCSNQHSWFWSPLSCRLKWSTCHWRSPMHVLWAPRNQRGWKETPHFSLT